jgi:hypothetical protein
MHFWPRKTDLALDAVRRGQKASPDDPRLVEREGDITAASATPPRRFATTSAWPPWRRRTR